MHSDSAEASDIEFACQTEADRSPLARRASKVGDFEQIKIREPQQFSVGCAWKILDMCKRALGGTFLKMGSVQEIMW